MQKFDNLELQKSSNLPLDDLSDDSLGKVEPKSLSVVQADEIFSCSRNIQIPDYRNELGINNICFS